MIGRTRFIVIAGATTLALVGCGTESSSSGEAGEPTVAAGVAELEAEMDQQAAEAEARVAELEAQVEELSEQADAEESVASATTVPTEPAVTETPAPPATSAAPPATVAPPPPPSDPFLIPPGVIEDGHHVGYLVSQSATSFSFDRADIQADGSWKNVNPKVRTLPVSTSANMLYGAPPGTPIEVFVSSQHVDWAISLGG